MPLTSDESLKYGVGTNFFFVNFIQVGNGKMLHKIVLHSLSLFETTKEAPSIQMPVSITEFQLGI